jgi:hypothetical protein
MIHFSGRLPLAPDYLVSVRVKVILFPPGVKVPKTDEKRGLSLNLDQ